MNQKKRNLLTYFACGFFLLFSLFTFTTLSPDITAWSEGTRFGFSAVTGLVFIMSWIVAYNE